MQTSKLRYVRFGLATTLLAAPLAFMPVGCDGENPLDTLCCSDFKPGTNMVNVDWGLDDAKLNVQFGVTMQAIGDLNGVATAMLTDLGTLCRNMAVELGEDPKAVTATDSAEVTQAWCELAAQAVVDVKVSGNIDITYQPAQCSFSAEVSASCEANCQVDASCDPGSVELRCDAGELSVKCEAGCTGSCEGSASVAVNCEGQCTGECEGMCMGNQNGSQCDGTCAGKCRGSCEVDAGATLQCDGECKGGCDGNYTAPKCTGELTPPMCEVEGNCQASCDASASAKAECTPPAVSVTGDATASLQIAVLKKYLPEIILIGEARAELVLDGAGAVLDAAGAIEGLSAEAALCIIPAALAIGDTVASLDVSLQASGSVLASVNN